MTTPQVILICETDHSKKEFDMYEINELYNCIELCMLIVILKSVENTVMLTKSCLKVWISHTNRLMLKSVESTYRLIHVQKCGDYTLTKSCYNV